MNIEKLVPFAFALALLVASTGQLSKIINAVRHAEFQLIQNSKASTWPKAPMLHPFKNPFRDTKAPRGLSSQPPLTSSRIAEIRHIRGRLYWYLQRLSNSSEFLIRLMN